MIISRKHPRPPKRNKQGTERKTKKKKQANKQTATRNKTKKQRKSYGKPTQKKIRKNTATTRSLSYNQRWQRHPLLFLKRQQLRCFFYLSFIFLSHRTQNLDLIFISCHLLKIKVNFVFFIFTFFVSFLFIFFLHAFPFLC